MVCLGNPPYRRWPTEDVEAGVRFGGWVRHGDPAQEDETREPPILETFIQPVQDADNGRHLHNLYNDYVAFWRWAMWKVFENPDDPRGTAERPGLVTFITASSYLRGPAFAGMREQMRHTFDHLWILDLGGEGRGAVKSENVFAIQTPVCIAIGVRGGQRDADEPAQVHYHRVNGTREQKLTFLAGLEKMVDVPWQDCPQDWQAPLMPQGAGDYWSWPKVTEIFPAQFNGVKVGRTWPIGETRDLLKTRWEALLAARPADRQALFKDSPTGRKVTTAASKKSLPAAASNDSPISLKPGAPPPRLERYAYRSFDRMWLMADHRMLDRSAPELWRAHGPKQVYLASQLTKEIGQGSAFTASACIPDLDYFCNRGGKDIIPLYLDAAATRPNLHPGLLNHLSDLYGFPVGAEDVFAYAYALLATPDYERRFREDLIIPGPRLPITRDGALFREAAAAGRELLHLHTYGERFGTGGVPEGTAGVKVDIPGTEAGYPAAFDYNARTRELHVGTGIIEHVSPEVWAFSVSGLKVVSSWLSYRMKGGAGKQSGDLAKLRPQAWTPELTEELLELLWVLETTLERHEGLSDLLGRVLAGKVLTQAELPEPPTQPVPQDAEDGDQPRLLS